MLKISSQDRLTQLNLSPSLITHLRVLPGASQEAMEACISLWSWEERELLAQQGLIAPAPDEQLAGAGLSSEFQLTPLGWLFIHQLGEGGRERAPLPRSLLAQLALLRGCSQAAVESALALMDGETRENLRRHGLLWRAPEHSQAQPPRDFRLTPLGREYFRCPPEREAHGKMLPPEQAG